MMYLQREKSSQRKNPRIFALRDEKNRQVCLMSRRRK